jgi:hypothetical protein
MKFTQVATDAFSELQLNAGILLTSFTPSEGTVDKANIFAATSGGNEFKAVPEFVDYGEDIDNVPLNSKQLKRINYYTCTMSGTAKTVNAATIQMLIGAADSILPYVLTADTEINSSKTYYTRAGTSPDYVYTAVDLPVKGSLGTYYEISPSGQIVPRHEIEDTDFHDIWWVGDYSAENGATNGGFIAICLLDAMNTSGFSIKSNDKGKGDFSYEFTGHYDLDNPDTVPFQVYIQVGEAE